MRVTLNPTLRVIAPKGYFCETFGQLVGQKIQLFLQNTNFVAHSEIDYLSTAEATNGERASIKSIYSANSGLIGVAVIGMRTGLKHAVYSVGSEEGYNACIKMLQECNGRHYDEIEYVRKYATSMSADNMYLWEARTFGESRLGSILKVMEYSVTEARKVMAGTKSLPITIQEAVVLVKALCTEYKIANLTVVGLPFDGLTMGCASRLSPSTSERVTEAEMRLAETTLLKHVVLHEFAHIVDYYRHGDSGHGNAFRETYETLLRNHHEDCADIAIPSLKGQVMTNRAYWKNEIEEASAGLSRPDLRDFRDLYYDRLERAQKALSSLESTLALARTRQNLSEVSYAAMGFLWDRYWETTDAYHRSFYGSEIKYWQSTHAIHSKAARATMGVE